MSLAIALTYFNVNGDLSDNSLGLLIMSSMNSFKTFEICLIICLLASSSEIGVKIT